MEDLLKIKGHHLLALDGLKKLSRGELVWLLLSEGYITEKKFSFLENLDEVYKYLEKPKQKVFVVSEREPDSICKKCRLKRSCEKRMPEIYISIYPIKVGETYSVKDIERVLKINFQKSE